MISLKRFIFSEHAEEQDMFLRTTQLLVQAVGLHAVKTDDADYERFRGDILQLEATLSEQPFSEALVVCGAVIKAMEEYNQRLSRSFRLRQKELKSIVSMLADNLASMTSASERSTRRLQTIENQLEKAAEIEDMRVLKSRLADCLEELQNERKRQAEEAAQQISGIQRNVEGSKRRLDDRQAEIGMDPLTGLSGRGNAEQVITKRKGKGEELHTAVFVVERVSAINSRFGYGAGDRVITAFLQHLMHSISASDQIYRWTGPAFVVLLKRDGVQAAEVREEVARVVGARLERTLEIGGRTVLLPVTASSVVFSVHSENDPRALFAKIDSFVEERLRGRSEVV